MNTVDTRMGRPRPTQLRAREPARHGTQRLYQNRYMVIGTILAVALIAFEIFNFDTTRYALTDLLGDIRFAGVSWAGILAVAFCGIDLAGLVRVFTPDDGDNSSEVVYLMAAWLLGATMNAMMTWYAVSITLLSHDIGNEVVSREQLLLYVPIFVAVLVWLTRVLFIGAFSIAGEQLFHLNNASTPKRKQQLAQPPRRVRSVRPTPAPAMATTKGAPNGTGEPLVLNRHAEMPTADAHIQAQPSGSGQYSPRIQAQ